MFYVYFLKLSNGQIYTGSTNNLRRRYGEHKSGRVFYTSHWLPCVLIGYEAYIIESDARRRERYLKSTAGKRLFRQQYKDILN